MADLPNWLQDPFWVFKVDVVPGCEAEDTCAGWPLTGQTGKAALWIMLSSLCLDSVKRAWVINHPPPTFGVHMVSIIKHKWYKYSKIGTNQLLL